MHGSSVAMSRGGALAEDGGTACDSACIGGSPGQEGSEQQLLQPFYYGVQGVRDRGLWLIG